MNQKLTELEARTSKVRIEKGTPDDIFVAKLAKVKLSFAEEQNLAAKENYEFADLLRRTLIQGGRTNYIQICAPYELFALTRILKPQHIVEVGVSAGVSSAYFLLALHLNGDGGVLHSIDFPEVEKETTSEKDRQWASWALPRGKEPGWAIPQYLRKNWDLRLGKSGDVMPGLISEVKRVGLFLYDVPYEIEGAIEDFRVIDQSVSGDSVVLADNCLIPISWWARRRRRAVVYNRKNSGLRGFRVKENS